jgi:hypothetical protein
MAKQKDAHVVPNKDGGWDIIQESAKAGATSYERQRDAELAAKELVRNVGGGEVFIHSRSGRIKERNTVGSDPYAPADRRAND